MKHRLRGADILRAFRVTLPVMAGYVVLGIGFGIGIAYDRFVVKKKKLMIGLIIS